MNSVAVVGAGIGGLTAAAALRRPGRRVRVYEAAPAFAEIGAGIWMPPNAMQVFARMGFADEVEAAGIPVRRAEVRDRGGRLLKAVELAPLRDRYGCGTVAIHRARLHEVLLARAGADVIRLGKRCEGLEVDDGRPGSACPDPRVRLRFADGSTATADLVIGADGVHSVVRGHVAPEARVRETGQVAVRGIAPVPLPPALGGVSTEYWGPGLRFGVVAIAPDESYWWCAYEPDAPSRGIDPSSSWIEEVARRFPSPVADVVAATPASARIRTPLSDLPPLSAWSRGPVVLLGDAAHAMTPNLGQGGAQAIEDAWVLARELDRGEASITEALRAFEDCRRKKADLLVRTSRWTGAVAHLRSRWARGVRDFLLRRMPDWMEDRQVRALYDVAPLTGSAVNTPPPPRPSPGSPPPRSAGR